MIGILDASHACLQFIQERDGLIKAFKLLQNPGQIKAIAVRPPGIRAFMFKAMS